MCALWENFGSADGNLFDYFDVCSLDGVRMCVGTASTWRWQGTGWVVGFRGRLKSYAHYNLNSNYSVLIVPNNRFSTCQCYKATTYSYTRWAERSSFALISNTFVHRTIIM